LREDYGNVLPQFISSIENIDRTIDFPFVAGKAVTIADIYLKKGDTSTCPYNDSNNPACRSETANFIK
jgi:hypothetical protein